jgi:hypothetical protein
MLGSIRQMSTSLVTWSKEAKEGVSQQEPQNGIFHAKKGTPTVKALLDKSKLKDGQGICLDFCLHEKKCNFPYQLCKNGKHYTN